jgi:glycosyltransferase involved in cell wall biosynthesis
MLSSGRRIVLDGSMATSGGGFTFMVNIVPTLAAGAPDDHFLFLTRSPLLASSIPERPNLEVDLLPEAGLPSRLRFVLLGASRLAKNWKADLYYSGGEYIPLAAPCPVITSFQNANVFNKSRMGWPLKEKVRIAILKDLARVSASRSSAVLFVSQDSARWMGDAIGLPEYKRGWLHHGVDTDERPTVKKENRVLERPYILSVSSIYRYKNYVRLIEAWSEIARHNKETPDLVIVGDNLDPPYWKQMLSARAAVGGLAERIHLVGGVSYAEVQRYFVGAELFVFPSYLETFGIPIIEAMAAGVPVVCADIPVFREVAGDAAIFADPHSTAALAGAMSELLESEARRDSHRRRGTERVKEFTWPRAATRLLDLFEQVLRRESR